MRAVAPRRFVGGFTAALGFAVLMALLLLLGGCAYSGVTLVDQDGTNVTMKERVFMSKRGLSRLSGLYDWDKDGAGRWAVGAAAETTDSTRTLDTVDNALELGGKLVLGSEGAAMPLPAPVPPRLGLRLLQPLLKGLNR